MTERNSACPMNRKKNTNFKRVDNVLNRVMVKLGLEKRLKEHTLMSMWPYLVGEPWDKRSRSLFIDSQNNLVVSVADASTGQELSLLKTNIMRKLRSAAATLQLEISGLRFDLKHFHGKTIEDLLVSCQRTLPEPSAADLNEIALTTFELEEISRLKSSLEQTETGGVSAQRIVGLFERELRLRHWRKANGYPICRFCGMPAPTLLGPDSYCSPCFFGDKQKAL